MINAVKVRADRVVAAATVSQLLSNIVFNGGRTELFSSTSRYL